MTLDALTAWATAHPWPTAAGAGAVVLAVTAAAWRLAHADRPPAAVLVAALGAAVCTTYSGDTSWRFAAHRLGMHSVSERAAMFSAGELALFACALLAREGLRSRGTPGAPGLLVWAITGVQIIPAYAESGIVGGTVRSALGPVLAAVLWHLAMGLELWHAKPGSFSSSLPAVILRELRERLLSRLGLAVRDRTAEQITRDRATARAVRLASRRRLHAWGERRLAAAVARARVGTDGQQRHQLLRDLAARRAAAQLATVPLESPWGTGTATVPEPYPRTPLGVTGAQLRAMEPVAAVRTVAAAHPHARPAEVAALATQYGVPVSEVQARVALGAGNTPTAERPAPRPVLDPASPTGLLLDVRTAPEVHPDVAAPAPVAAAGSRRPEVHARIPEPTEQDEPDHARVPDPAPAVPDTAGTADLLTQARGFDADHRRTHGRPASIRALKTALHIGQQRATEVRAALDHKPAAR